MELLNSGYFKKKDSGSFTPTSDITTYTTISHTLGEKPKLVIIAADVETEFDAQLSVGMTAIYTEDMFNNENYGRSVAHPYVVTSIYKSSGRSYFEGGIYRSGNATGDNFNQYSSNTVFMFAPYSGNYPIKANITYHWVAYA